jgi:hypothetical protein
MVRMTMSAIRGVLGTGVRSGQHGVQAHGNACAGGDVLQRNAPLMQRVFSTLPR